MKIWLSVMVVNNSSHGNRVDQRDSVLLKRYRRGDDDAATALYIKYASRLRHLAKSNTSDDLKTRFDADDVVQSVFRTFFRRATEGYFDAPHGDELWNLFLVIALNKVRGHGKFHRRKMRDVGATRSIEDGVFASEDTTPLATLEMSIAELLDTLPERKRKIVELRIMGFSMEDIAKETKRCTRTIERTLKQFRDMLSRQIHDS